MRGGRDGIEGVATLADGSAALKLRVKTLLVAGDPSALSAHTAGRA